MKAATVAAGVLKIQTMRPEIKVKKRAVNRAESVGCNVKERIVYRD